MKFDDVYWHDGQIQSLLVACSEQSGCQYRIRIEADVYSSEDSPDRTRIAVTFGEVEKLVLACNIIEMNDYFGSGNISNGYKKGKNDYILYLADGYVEIMAGKVVITTI